MEKGGGINHSGIRKDTNYLVLGVQDYMKLKDKKYSSKMKKAFEYQERGTGIEIISEEDFLNMIDDELYNTVFG